MVYSSYMVSNGGSICEFSTLWRHRCKTKHAKSSARVIIDGGSQENATDQICTQYGLMDHINLRRSTPVREPEEGCLCFSVFHTTFLEFGVVEKSHQTELVRRMNSNYLGDIM